MWINTQGAPATFIEYDTFDRDRRVDTSAFGDKVIVKKTVYDALGRMCARHARLLGDPTRYATLAYDILNRATTETDVDGSQTSPATTA